MASLIFFSTGFVSVKFWPESCDDGRMCDILVSGGGAGWEEVPPVSQEEEVKPETGPAVDRRMSTSASLLDSPHVAHHRDGLTPHGRQSPNPAEKGPVSQQNTKSSSLLFDSVESRGKWKT